MSVIGSTAQVENSTHRVPSLCPVGDFLHLVPARITHKSRKPGLAEFPHEEDLLDFPTCSHKVFGAGEQFPPPVAWDAAGHGQSQETRSESPFALWLQLLPSWDWE